METAARRIWLPSEKCLLSGGLIVSRYAERARRLATFQTSSDSSRYMATTMALNSLEFDTGSMRGDARIRTRFTFHVSRLTSYMSRFTHA